MKTITTILAAAIALSATTAHANPYYKYKAWNQNKKDRIEAAVSIADLESFSGVASGEVTHSQVNVSYKSFLSDVLTEEASESLADNQMVLRAKIVLNGEVLTHDNDLIEVVEEDNGFGGIMTTNYGIAMKVDLGSTITYNQLATVAEDLATLAAEAAYDVGYDDGYSDGYADGWNARGAAIAAELNCTWCD